jgi:hypothetical protein
MTDFSSRYISCAYLVLKHAISWSHSDFCLFHARALLSAHLTNRLFVIYQHVDDCALYYRQTNQGTFTVRSKWTPFK